MRPLTAGRMVQASEPARRRGFVTATAVLAVFLAAAAAPSPLYAQYALSWQFTATSLTAVFAVYALALLLALLVTGTLSDTVGRRPVIVTGLLAEAASMVLFLRADSLSWLYAARTVQGLATGLVTAALAATLIDLQPPQRAGVGALVNAVTPTFGLGAGALGAGVLVQYAPAPFRLVYALLLVTFLVLAVAASLALPTGGTGRISLRPHIGLELGLRAEFARALPCLVATWALGGLYLSLGPSVAAVLTGSDNRLVGAAVVSLLTGAGGSACLTVRSWPPPTAMLAGCAALAGGSAITLVGIAWAGPVVFFVGTAIAGAGFGAGFLGAFRALAGRASPEGRAGLVSVIYIAAYLAFAVPAVLAGLLTTLVGLRATAAGYAAAVCLLATVAIATTGRTRPAAVDPR